MKPTKTQMRVLTELAQPGALLRQGVVSGRWHIWFDGQMRERVSFATAGTLRERGWIAPSGDCLAITGAGRAAI